MSPKNHVVDHSLIHQIADLYKAGNSRHHTENRHLELVLKQKKMVIIQLFNFGLVFI